MHFFYIDESGCTGEDLANAQQPVFVAGGLVVRDEGWNRTKEAYSSLIHDYFAGDMPQGFELHAHHLLSPAGDGFFSGHPRERRNALAHAVIDLIEERSHQVAYIALDKQRLANAMDTDLKSKAYLPRRAPYTLAYDYLISKYEWFAREKLGNSARGLVIADTKSGFDNDIAEITNYRRVSAPAAQRVKWLTEFTYAVDSHKNPMIQISDLVCFATRKFLELDAGYRANWCQAAKEFARELYVKVHDRLIRKELLPESGHYSNQYNSFIADVGVWPRPRFKSHAY